MTVQSKLRLSDVLRTAERVYGLPKGSILAPGRTYAVVEARRLCAFIGKVWFEFSYPYIGKLMKRDHATILHHCQEMIRLLRAEPDRVEDMRELLATALEDINERLDEEEFVERLRLAVDKARQSEGAAA
mgnify:CR=1 FL=1|jgi:ATPase involved in DNA replication initiation